MLEKIIYPRHHSPSSGPLGTAIAPTLVPNAYQIWPNKEAARHLNFTEMRVLKQFKNLCQIFNRMELIYINLHQYLTRPQLIKRRVDHLSLVHPPILRYNLDSAICEIAKVIQGPIRATPFGLSGAPGRVSGVACGPINDRPYPLKGKLLERCQMVFNEGHPIQNDCKEAYLHVPVCFLKISDAATAVS
jgi:hypothetical protein